MTTTQITTQAFGEQSELVLLDGRNIGSISGRNNLWLADMQGARYGTYMFASRDDAIAAVVSYARHGWWTGEITRSQIGAAS